MQGARVRRRAAERGESAVDCGGDCAPCGLGRGCVDDVDCESGECQANQCTAPCPSWARQWGSANTDHGRGVAVDGDDDVIVVGSLGSDLSVKKVDVAGTELWADVLDSGEIDLGLAVAVDAAGNAFVAGTTHGGLAGNVHIGNADAFVIKYAPDGAKLWSRQFGTNPDDRALGVAVDDAGNAVVVGLTVGSLDGNVAAGIEDIFVAKFDPQGVKLWTKQFGTSNYDSAWGVAAGPNGAIVVAGTTAGSFDGDPSAGQGTPSYSSSTQPATSSGAASSARSGRTPPMPRRSMIRAASSSSVRAAGAWTATSSAASSTASS
ncbi:hypothetical protein [Nannocystis pusilla]|uniref:hypothetical protein n=1 Tax=Nannocystis pusilla TaxID=889268 RepID=UPI003B7D01E7